MAAGAASFTRSWLSRSKYPSLPSCRRLRYAGKLGRGTCLEALSGQGKRAAPRRAFSHLCVNGGLYASQTACDVITRVQRDYLTDEKSRLCSPDKASFADIRPRENAGFVRRSRYNRRRGAAAYGRFITDCSRQLDLESFCISN